MLPKLFDLYSVYFFAILIGVVTFDGTRAKAIWGKPKNFATNHDSRPLIVISFDGFRWDYLSRTSTPNFDKFLKYGVTARHGLRNAFVTKTFPNHFTLATGLWEENHGIVANVMYDPVLNQTFTSSNISAMNDPAWFNVGAEPIWVTNQLQTLNGRSGVIMWVGGGAPIKWVKPSRYVPFSKSVTNETKIDTLVEWFTDEYPINLGMIYFDQPDGFGHAYGPDSPQVTGMIGGLDEVVGYLLKRLEEKGLLDSMNIIITSDHGFTNTPAENMINLDHYLDPESYTIPNLSPIATIWPNEGKLEEIYRNLTAGAKIHGNFTVYKREEVPAHFHYTNNRRISPVVAVAADTFSFCTGVCQQWEKGDHGYDNTLQDMHPFFLAMGPSFKQNFSVDTFDNVDVYPLMCHLLGLTPASNNGSLAVVSELLVTAAEDYRILITTYIFSAIFIVLVGGVFVAGASKILCSNKNTKLGEYSNIVDQHQGVVESAEMKSNRNGNATEVPSKLSGSKIPLLLAQDADSSS